MLGIQFRYACRYSKYTSESGSQCFEEYVDKVAKVSIHSLPYK